MQKHFQYNQLSSSHKAFSCRLLEFHYTYRQQTVVGAAATNEGDEPPPLGGTFNRSCRGGSRRCRFHVTVGNHRTRVVSVSHWQHEEMLLHIIICVRPLGYIHAALHMLCRWWQLSLEASVMGCFAMNLYAKKSIDAMNHQSRNKWMSEWVWKTKTIK